MKTVVFALILSVMLFACEKEKTIEDGPIVGYWTLAGYEDNVAVMKRVTVLKEDQYGFIFSSGGKFTEHANAGWCGTPPIVYDNFEGSWARTAGNEIHIHVAYWGGTTSYTMQIVSLERSTLKYIPHYQ